MTSGIERLRREPAARPRHVRDPVGAGVVDADVEHVGALAHLVAGHRDVVSQSPASIASRNCFEPLAFVRSPTTRNEVSCANGTKL